MNQEEINEYISALADKDVSGLTDEEIKTLETLMKEYPEYFEGYELDLATKICLTKRNAPLKCPTETQIKIKASIARMLNAIQSAK